MYFLVVLKSNKPKLTQLHPKEIAKLQFIKGARNPSNCPNKSANIYLLLNRLQLQDIFGNIILLKS